MRRLLLILCVSVLGMAAGAARAQDRDVQPLLDRIDRLERDVNLLQRQVYQGAYQNGAAPAAPGAGGEQSALGNELAVSQLQEQMRSLNGQIEEINYNLNQLKTRLDKLSGDVDLRFSQLGGGGAPPPASPAAVPPPPPGGGNPLRPPPGRQGSLGSLPGGAPPAAQASNQPPPPPAQQQAAAPANTASGVLPSGSTQDQYNYAFGLLRRADYPGAEQALKSFVQRYPSDPLAGNAQYWLGETYFVRKNYKDAATAFAEGYQKYPKGAKAPDNLLKLGVTLSALGQKSDACKAFARLDRDFPSAPGNVKEQEATERQGAGC